MSALPPELTIGEVAERTGLATSALRYYEERGLISSERTDGNQRRYRRAVIRRVSVIKAAQTLGLTLEEVGGALEALPEGRTPTARDWARLSGRWRADLDARIAGMEALRDDLDGCIGCGCLSLDTCSLFNRDDRAADAGRGPRYLLGDERPEA